MEVSEWKGILKTALQNGGFYDTSLKNYSDEEEFDENWQNVLPVEVNVEPVEDVEPENENIHSDSDSDFFGFLDGLIPVNSKGPQLKLSKVVSQCPYCSYRSRRKDHFKRHVVRHPEQTLYPWDSLERQEKKKRSCTECGYTTIRLDHFKRHLMRHTGEKPYSCACGYSTTHGVHLKRHILRFPDPNFHYSLNGNLTFAGRNDVSSVHNSKRQEIPVGLRINSDEILSIEPVTVVKTAPEKGPANELTKTLNGSQDNIKIEENDISAGEWGIGLWPVEVKLEEVNDCISDEENKLKKKRRGGPHVCKDCGYSTMRGDHFKRHLMRHTGEKPYSCSVCDYRSTHAIHLKRHMSIHTGVRPFQCNYCPFRAIRPHHLRDHERIHTGERPYICELCGFSASKSDNFRIHMRTHSGQRLHSCELCSYSTVKESNLISHMRTHTEKYGYGCMLCDYRSIKSSEVFRHTEQVHNIELTTVTQTDISIYQSNDS